MFNLAAYANMVADERRTGAYDNALRKAVRPNSVVLDLGCGPGILSLLACRAGARRVYAIEHGDAIELGRALAHANGYADRIVFIQDFSTRVQLPEKVDVIVSDLRGVLPLYQHLIPSIVDARRRFLAPGGVLLPQEDALWFAPVTAPEISQRLRRGWEHNHYGLVLDAGLRHATNMWRKERVRREQCLAGPQPWVTLDYRTIESPNVSREATWTAAADGIGHGFALWFDSVLFDDVRFTSAPWEPELIYGSGFFPWSEPVPIQTGDSITIHLAADLVGDGYVFRWNTQVTDPGGRSKATFRQSTLFGAPLSPERLQRQSSAHTPVLDQDGEIDRTVLALMDGKNLLEEIARRVASAFPQRFHTWQEALSRVSELSQKYGR
ncbi:MAG: 50S ribosomal protein L11 methyltransferase [Candidatus Koribacter versatilis]|uniref:50S ribosomal protein L11 methyltransferase n=1 Tax=Candidatus Korobacter versatilis TaxID=658062 RepID=A0A932EPI2_9BACT|nr:50S ribosomal protein L11 methyltransferase [Candidatus Koribacter versatilis]